MKNSKNWSAEVDAIERRALGIITVEEPSEVAQAFSQALSGETPLGDGSAWVVIGGIKLGTTAVVKSPLGQPMFNVTIEPLPGLAQGSDIHPVLVKRSEDGAIEKLTIDFTKVMDYANLSEKPFTPAETIGALQALVKMGVLKPKG